MPVPAEFDAHAMVLRLRRWAKELGFADCAIAGVDVSADAAHLADWLAQGQHGEMAWMGAHDGKRGDPAALIPGTRSIISVRMDYATGDDAGAWATLADGARAYVARYALGRDYHKVLRRKLQQLADRLQAELGPLGHRVFVDSAPVLERAVARNAGLGWIGKHTCLIHRDHGSWFFLGELFVDIALPTDPPATAHCGTCARCIEVCPTQAIVAPHRLDARRCISYLTIELKGSIPEEFRAAIGNRIFGCDDCQLICPWNKFATRHQLPDFEPRNELDQAMLVDLFRWSEAEFLQRTEGSAIRRTGWQGWRRNIAVALGNAPSSPAVLEALAGAQGDSDAVVAEHVAWALAQHAKRLPVTLSP